LRTVAVVVSVAGYTLLAPMGYVPFAFLCWLWRDRPLVAARRLQTCMQWGFRFTLGWLRLVRIADCRYDGVPDALPPGPCVVVANHPTLLDVLAVTACLGGATTIVKPSVFNRRLVHPFLVGAGLLEGPGQDPISIGRVIDDCVRRLRDGMRIYVFPEGSRSPPGRLRPFGRVAFEIACRANVPLVVLGIRCEPVYLSREVPLFRPPHPTPRLRLELLAIEQPKAHGNSRKLAAAVERRLRAWCLGENASGDPART
jgi:1-acyl-sn-glycerol-3-phosphate acyltransferase